MVHAVAWYETILVLHHLGKGPFGSAVAADGRFELKVHLVQFLPYKIGEYFILCLMMQNYLVPF